MINSVGDKPSPTEIASSRRQKLLHLRRHRRNPAAAKPGGGIAKQARKQLESQTGKSVVSKQNYLAPGAAKGLVKPSLRMP
jgi:hypothetical protein